MNAFTAASLFNDQDLTDVVGYPVVRQRAAAVEAIVWGRVKPILDIGERPEPRDDTVHAIALQLGVLLYENPGLWSRSSTGVDSTDYDTRAAADALLDDLRSYKAGTSQTSTSGLTPRGAFPDAASCWPDPAVGWSNGPTW